MSTEGPGVRTTCPYCGVGCGIVARPDGRGGADISGDPEHPANFGRLCSKGAALAETLGLERRLLHPVVRGRRASWDAALDEVAGGFQRIFAEHGPAAIAFYLSGQLLTEDYYVANKLAKGFIGTPHVDTNSRLCMASSVAGHRRAFGSDTVPGLYEDLDETDLLVLVGSNAAWCHPVLFRRMEANRLARGARIVAVDPRRTATAEEADLFLPIRPGTDAELFGGLLVHLADEGRLDAAYIAGHTSGFAEALARARALTPDPPATAQATGLAEPDVARFFAMFAATERAVTLFSQGVNQSVRGTDTVNAIINVHLATGRIGWPGAGPFSLTGQPNAMGGREVGGLANMLAAHMGFSEPERDRVRRFWGAPSLVSGEGYKAVALFEAIERGEVRALWVLGTNPAVSLPAADRFREALRRLDLLVVSDVVASNDTIAADPHVLLPAAAWGEKDGTVTNSERRISRQRAFLDLPGEARPDWWALAELARRLGYGSAFEYDSPAAIFREHAALSGFENDGARDFDISALAEIEAADYDALEPVLWPQRKGVGKCQARFFAQGGFYTPDRRARFVPVEQPAAQRRSTQPFLLRLNTGRVRDQWHSMTRTGLSPRLARHAPAPFVAIHPTDAAAAGLQNGGLARVETAQGSAVLEVAVTEAQRPGHLFAPIHWSDATAAAARICALVHAVTDPVSGQPDAKGTRSRVEPVSARFRGFILGPNIGPLPRDEIFPWWARLTLDDAEAVLFATNAEPRDVAERAPLLFDGLDLAEYADRAAGTYRCVAFSGSRLEGCLFLGPAAAPPDWDVVSARIGHDCVPAVRNLALSGRAGAEGPAAGPLVCSCFGIGLVAISATIRTGARSPEAIGAALRAGTNCGSCIPELRRILSGELVPD